MTARRTPGTHAPPSAPLRNSSPRTTGWPPSCPRKQPQARATPAHAANSAVSDWFRSPRAGATGAASTAGTSGNGSRPPGAALPAAGGRLGGPELSTTGPSTTGPSGTGPSSTGLSGNGLSGNGLSGAESSGAWAPGTGLSGTGALSGTGLSGTGLSGNSGWAPGRHAAQIIADPVRGDQTAAGLPVRVPRANLLPGSAGGGHRPGSGPASRTGGNHDGQTPAAPRPPRSPDVARSRLSGFQRGVRRAKDQTPRDGEGADR